MSTSRRQERRLLSTDELELVDQTHQPALTELSANDLQRLIGLVRERRDRARDIAHRQRRQVRGKGRHGGTAPEHKDSGNRRKSAILGEALTRLNSERSRRTSRDSLVANARRALAMKKKSEPARSRPRPGRTAHHGMHPRENEKPKDLTRPMEAGRVSQFVRDAQAKRDAR